MSKQAGEASKKVGPTLQKIADDLRKELRESKDTLRSLLDKRSKQNETLDYPDLSGAWESNYYGSWKGTTIAQNGKTLTFTNEKGDSSPGEFLSKTTVKATKWEGGMTATVSENRIVWSNGSIWRRKGSSQRILHPK